MRYRENQSNSDSSYDIVPVPVSSRRHPRAPTTVQILPDDFDAITHDYETAVATEVYPYDGVTEVRTMGQEDGESERRYSRVYGEWAERHEVHRRQAAMPADFGKYMEEVTRRLQEVGVDEQGNLLDATIRARGATVARQYQPQKEGEREGKVSMWREQVAKNDINLSEFGGSVAGTNDTIRRNREETYTLDQGTVKTNEVESTLRKSQSNVSQSYRSEVYTPADLSIPCALKPQKTAGTIVKREKRTRDPSPTRSERIYTLAEINALTGQNMKHSPPGRKNGFRGQEIQHNKTASSNSPPQNQKAKHLTSSPASLRSRSSSTSSIEGVLSSCQPSLLHIAPVLSNLGIRREEHLRALARLREETRDRELKEEMLKQGVTLLEWAILVDKLLEF